jgi:predicted nucleic acid-binding protein
MGEGYLIDTSAVSKALTGQLNTTAMQLMLDALRAEHRLSVITRIELLVWNPPSEKLKVDVRLLIDNSTILSLTEPIILQTVRIRRQHRVKLPDALIAATAMAHNLTLLSTNDRDFETITGLAYRSLNQ